MGVEWGDDVIVIKPFADTTTCRNLTATGVAVVNLTDDALLFAKAVTGHPDAASPPTVAAVRVTWRVLAAACSWREVEVTASEVTQPRARFTTRVVHRGSLREFLASTGPGMPCWRRRFWRPGPTSSPAPRSGPNSTACGSSWRRPQGRMSGPR
jgi:hypothetical protein